MVAGITALIGARSSLGIGIGKGLRDFALAALQFTVQGVARDNLASGLRTAQSICYWLLGVRVASCTAQRVGLPGPGSRLFAQLPLPLSEAHAQMGEVVVMTNNTLNEDANEGIGAFLGKRHPEWKMQ